MKKNTFRAGDAVHVLPAHYELKPGPGTPDNIQEHIAQLATIRINEAIEALTNDAYGAGFRLDVKSVTHQSDNWVILYRLTEDASFHPPM